MPPRVTHLRCACTFQKQSAALSIDSPFPYKLLVIGLANRIRSSSSPTHASHQVPKSIHHVRSYRSRAMARSRRKAGHVRCLQDARRVVAMYGHRVGFDAKVVALHGGIRHARAVHAILSRQLSAGKSWKVRAMWKLELLVPVHRDIATAAESLDHLILSFTSAHPPPAPGSPISLESVHLRLTACVLDDDDDDDRRPHHFAGDELLRATSLRDAGIALLHRVLGGGIVEDKVRGLGELLLGLATSMITEGPIPPVLFDDAAPVERPPPSKAKLLQYMRQAKRHVLDVWDARISKTEFAGIW